jgi:2-keto-4-pentenoate hydratase/2-oxohepta-3-ene-1,7-dioic acid hydratase in catechol pathway
MTSSVMTLQPGDIIATGTPAGVGPILPGDEVKVDIEKIGSMTLPVVQGEGGSNLAFEFAAREAAAGR